VGNIVLAAVDMIADVAEQDEVGFANLAHHGVLDEIRAEEARVVEVIQGILTYMPNQWSVLVKHYPVIMRQGLARDDDARFELLSHGSQLRALAARVSNP